MIHCKICSGIFETKKNISNHLYRMHNITGIERESIILESMHTIQYINDIVDDYKNGKMAFYKVPTEFHNFIRLLGIKRTASQEKKTPRYVNSFKKIIYEKYGVENISQLEWVKEKKNISVTRKYGSVNEYYEYTVKNLNTGLKKYIDDGGNLETYEKSKKTCLLKYGHENFGAGELAKEKSKESLKIFYENLTYEERLKRTEKMRSAVVHRGGFSSKIEKRVRKALIDLDILDTKYNKMVLGYNWDIVFNNILIEVQGTFWHAKPEYYKENDLILGKLLVKDIWEKDKRKHNKARDNGYIVIEIWEDDINKLSDHELTLLLKEKLNEYM